MNIIKEFGLWLVLWIIAYTVIKFIMDFLSLKFTCCKNKNIRLLLCVLIVVLIHNRLKIYVGL